MPKKTYARMLDVLEEERRELAHHQGVLAEQERRLRQRLADWETDLARAGRAVDPQQHDQYLRYAQLCEERKQQTLKQLDSLAEARQSVTAALGQLYQRRRSFEHLIDNERKAEVRKQDRRRQRLADGVALRQWMEAD